MRGKKALVPVRDYFDFWKQREDGMSIKDLCKWGRGYNADIPLSPPTVYRILAECRKRFGRLENLPRPRRQRAHLFGQYAPSSNDRSHGVSVGTTSTGGHNDL